MPAVPAWQYRPACGPAESAAAIWAYRGCERGLAKPGSDARLLPQRRDGYAEGTINIALAPLMAAVGSRPATAGLLIALLSLASAAGGFAYAVSSGHLPGDTDQRANIALLALGLCASLIALAPSLITVALAVAACGIWFAPLNAMCTLILGRLLPASQLSEGFSTLSAAMQMGYGASGIATGAVLGIWGARACFLIAAAVTVSSAAGAWLLHQRSKDSQVPRHAEPPESHR